MRGNGVILFLFGTKDVNGPRKDFWVSGYEIRGVETRFAFRILSLKAVFGFALYRGKTKRFAKEQNGAKPWTYCSWKSRIWLAFHET